MNLPGLDDMLGTMYSQLAANKRLDRVAGYWNGFEGWLKFELATGLQEAYGVEPWVGSGTDWDTGAVGVEYRYRADTHQRTDYRSRNDQASKAKLVDLWFGKEETYYFELKIVFRNNNAGKQLRSWRADMEKLAIVLEDDETVRGYASVIVAVGYDDDEWGEATRQIADDTSFRDLGILSAREPDRVGIVRFAALRRQVVSR